MNELNRKLAEWAGWSSKIPMNNPYYTAPDFTQSLDACFKWLVQDIWCVYFFIGGVCLVVDSENSEVYLGVNAIKATALCLAIEKLIDGEK